MGCGASNSAEYHDSSAGCPTKPYIPKFKAEACITPQPQETEIAHRPETPADRESFRGTAEDVLAKRAVTDEVVLLGEIVPVVEGIGTGPIEEDCTMECSHCMSGNPVLEAAQSEQENRHEATHVFDKSPIKRLAGPVFYPPISPQSSPQSVATPQSQSMAVRTPQTAATPQPAADIDSSFEELELEEPQIYSVQSVISESDSSDITSVQDTSQYLTAVRSEANVVLSTVSNEELPGAIRPMILSVLAIATSIVSGGSESLIEIEEDIRSRHDFGQSNNPYSQSYHNGTWSSNLNNAPHIPLVGAY